MLNDSEMKRTMLAILSLAQIATGEWLNLWPAETPDPGAAARASGTEKVAGDTHISEVERAQYELFLPPADKRTGAGVVIFPGGGYSMLAAGHEGKGYADWLNQRGIAAMVVKYRVSTDDAAGFQYPVPYLDARRAIRTMRLNAEEWKIDPSRIGVMGSSAGGHLASVCATRFDDTFAEEEAHDMREISARPDFAVLIYPVILMDNPYGHSGSQRRLLGENPDRGLTAKLSTDQAVTAETPPTFLLSTTDDPVDCRNSLDFAIALKAHNVPFELHVFPTGGHGYGLNGAGALEAWPPLLERWLTDNTAEKR